MIRAFAPAIVWLIAVIFLSTTGGVSMPSFDLLQTDKLAHAAAYCLLSWLTLWGFARWQSRVKISHGVFTVLVATSVGALLEDLQFRYFPHRHFEYDDMIANAVGALVGWVVFARLFSHRHLAAWLEQWS